MLPVFLDTSWSDEGGGRMNLRLGEAGAVKILLSPQVLAEIERASRRKGPGALPLLAVLLDRARVEVGPEPAGEIIRSCRALVSHPADAAILAGAVAGGADYFVTLDRQHFLDNPRLQGAVPFEVGTPGDFLVWLRGRLAAVARLSGSGT
jgi:predicted nucleic acid-binding protein